MADRQETDLKDPEATLADFEAGRRDYRFALNESAVLEGVTAAMTADQEAVFEVRL
ncbi:hypothetical protein [Jannaschia faecimaris]|uniref:hypothetical protein n=1 Tax=Jannaschia faecimaris TaxID=1244108 RepID=UPI00147DF434|nr:hypothetical protein [Jannaschia faecimaris]